MSEGLEGGVRGRERREGDRGRSDGEGRSGRESGSESGSGWKWECVEG